MTRATASHESFEEHREVKTASDRNFGFTVGGILAAIGLVRWFWLGHAGLASEILVGVGALLMLLAAVAPSLLAWPNRIWTGLGFLLARIVNPLVMLAMFLLIFTPIALGMRLAGRDALRMRNHRSLATGWVDREPPAPDPKGAVNQF